MILSMQKNLIRIISIPKLNYNTNKFTVWKNNLFFYALKKNVYLDDYEPEIFNEYFLKGLSIESAFNQLKSELTK